MKIKILFNIMRKQILLFFVLSIFFSNAQTKWTLEECVIYALENNISIKQTENALLINDQDIISAKGNFMPLFGINASQSLSLGNIQVFDGQFIDRTFHSTNMGVSVSQTVFNGFRNTNIYKQSLINKEANLEDYKRIKDNVSLNVVNSYLNVLLNKENLNVSQAQCIFCGTAQYDFSLRTKINSI